MGWVVGSEDGQDGQDGRMDGMDSGAGQPRSGNEDRYGPFRSRLEGHQVLRKRQSRESLILGFILGSDLSLTASFATAGKLKDCKDWSG